MGLILALKIKHNEHNTLPSAVFLTIMQSLFYFCAEWWCIFIFMLSVVMLSVSVHLILMALLGVAFLLLY
jgi:predicted RND superfamily exporter protein